MTTRRLQRCTAGAAALALALTGLGATAAAADEFVGSNAVHAEPDDYTGPPGPPTEGASAAATSDESVAKPDAEPFTATNRPGREDVPGQGSVEDAAEEAAGSGEVDLTLPAGRTGDSDKALRQAVERDGSVRVIVMMRTDLRLESDLSAAGVQAQRARIDASLSGLSSTLDGTGSTLEHELEVVPSAVYTVSDRGLEALLDDPDVAAVTIDGEMQAQLDVSTSVIGSYQLNATGVLGDGFVGEPVGRYDVAIIDSGVDNQHNAFSGRIVAQACYSNAGDCPNGSTVQVGAGAGDNCTHSSDCYHGTHVGSIAAGASFTGGHQGVARGAGIVAMNVASDGAGSRWTAFFSDINLALQRVLTLKGSSRPDLVSANMSIGTTDTFPDASCDGLLPTMNTLFGQLTSAGVAPVVAAGNSGVKTEMSLPGCLSNAIAIGATNNVDTPAGFSNTSPRLDFFAPGVGIDAAVPTTNNHLSASGTSMAAPHVAGSFALLQECIPYTSPGTVIAGLNASGRPVTDNGVTRDRIDVLDAATRTVNNNDFANAETLPANGYDDYDWNVCADAQPGEPGPGSNENSVWWNWTPASTGIATISTNDAGGNVTTFDTTLSVFTGNSLSNLDLVAYDDDSGDGLRSLVVIPANAGTTYRIRVDGFGGSNGELNLHVHNDPPPECWGQPATILGGAGNDVLNGTQGNDVIVAGDGNDRVTAWGGEDRICLGAGNDRVHAGNGADHVWGGPGADFIIGGNADDRLVGNAGGGDTDDVGDRIYGNVGNDYIDGWVGDDRMEDGAGDDQFVGAAGTDVVFFTPGAGAVIADLTNGTATGQGDDTLSGVENLVGTYGHDRLRGTHGDNRLTGRSGRDVLIGRGGEDVMRGNAGNDRLYGNYHDDRLYGGDGRDQLRGSNGNDHLFGEGDKDFLSGQQNNDVLHGGGAVDKCKGGAGVDSASSCEIAGGIP